MPFADRVQESSSTTGTGTFTLTGAVAGYQGFTIAFSGPSTAAIPYCAIDAAGNWETGVGTFTASGTTLTRSVQQSSNSNALVSFGAGLKVFVTLTTVAISGLGGLIDFTESSDSFGINSTVPVVRLSATNAATNVDIALASKGTGGLAAQLADGSTSGGNKRGANHVDWQQVRNTNNQIASGAGATIGGGYNNKASDTNTTVAGGQSNYASAQWATVGGGNDNQSAVNYGTIGGGQGHRIHGGVNGTIGGGDTNEVSGLSATISGGANCVADGDYSVAGGWYASSRGLIGVIAYAAGRWSSVGDTQYMHQHLHLRTTDATSTVLTGDGNAEGSANSIALVNNSARAGKVRVLAFETATSDAAMWDVDVLITCDGSGTVAIIGSPTVTPLYATAGAIAGSWAVSLATNGTFKTLEVLATGEAASSIRWVCDFSGLLLVQ